jgi:hypothetical protein
MKTIVLCLFSFLHFLMPVHGADTREFDRLQSGYKDALDRAIKPLTQTYIRELERMRDAFTREAKFDAANKVQAEIDAVRQSTGQPANQPAVVSPTLAKAATTAPTDDSASTPSPKMPELRWIVGRSWVTDRETTWSFTRDVSLEISR